MGGAPAWIGAGLVALALVALLRRSTRPLAVAAWAAALAGLAWGVAAATLASGPVWIGTPLVLTHGALLVAVAAASSGLREELAGSSFGLRQLVGTAAVLVGSAALVAGSVWWLLSDPVETDRVLLPRYMAAAGEDDPTVGTLVLRGGYEAGITFEVRRGEGPYLGDEALVPAPGREQRMVELVGSLAGSPDRQVVEELAGQGIEFVLLPAPVDPGLGAALDAAPGLTAASSGREDARAWRAESEPSFVSPDDEGVGAVRAALLAVQLLGVVAVVVLAAPGRRSRG